MNCNFLMNETNVHQTKKCDIEFMNILYTNILLRVHIYIKMNEWISLFSRNSIMSRFVIKIQHRYQNSESLYITVQLFKYWPAIYT